MNFVILHSALAPDAPPDELDVLVQVEAISAALQRSGHLVQTLPFSLNLAAVRDRLLAAAPDAVFNLVESVDGRGALIHLAPALLESLRLPFTGTPSQGMLLSNGKLLAKRLLLASGLPTHPWHDPAAESALFAPGRYIVKSVSEHASFGMGDDAVIDAADPARLDAALADRHARHGGEWFAERYIDGREFNLSVLAEADGPRVLPPAEIEFLDYPADKPRLVDYRAKWDAESFEYRNTPRRFDFPAADRPLLGELERLALHAHALFGMGGYCRVDFRVDSGGRPWILELNANPCLSPDAGLAAAADRAGLTYDALIARILDAALRLQNVAAPR
jgi:D-alanine-D-alanine ligase